MNNGYLLLQQQQQHPDNYYHVVDDDGYHHPGWKLENITMSFFKCIRWQVEETTDPLNCPYHYFCDGTYPAGEYPPLVDTLVLLFTAILYLVTLVFTVQEMMILTNYAGSRRPRRELEEEEEEEEEDVIHCSSSGSRGSSSWRYWIPSGPIALPFILVSLAKGHHINSAPFIGPALLQLLHISALAFEQNNAPEEDVIMDTIKFVLFDLSTVSGILHASLYLDAVILPYYTGLDALVLSTSFSGECVSCVCRKEVLLVGGRLVSYRGWSVTMFSVVGALCWRILCKLLVLQYGRGGEDSRASSRRYIMVVAQLIQKTIFETTSWILIAIDSVYLMMNSPQRDAGSLESGAAYGCACALICLHVLKKLQSTRTLARCHYQKMRSHCKCYIHILRNFSTQLKVKNCW